MDWRPAQSVPRLNECVMSILLPHCLSQAYTACAALALHSSISHTVILGTENQAAHRRPKKKLSIFSQPISTGVKIHVIQ